MAYIRFVRVRNLNSRQAVVGNAVDEARCSRVMRTAPSRHVSIAQVTAKASGTATTPMTRSMTP